MIEANGGQLSNYVECFTYQISHKNNYNESLYQTGAIYIFDWIMESVRLQTLLNPQDFLMAEKDPDYNI